MFVNSWARSTFDISTAPDVTSEKLPPGVPTLSGPELLDADQRLLETRCRPASLANCASERYPAVTRAPPAAGAYETEPSRALDRFVAPAGIWTSWSAPPPPAAERPSTYWPSWVTR